MSQIEEISKILKDYGLSDEAIENVSKNISGEDLINLISLKDSSDFAKLDELINSLITEGPVTEMAKKSKEPKSKNPFAMHVTRKGGSGPHENKSKKRDSLDRKAKHKKDIVSEETQFDQAETVLYKGKKVPVTIPNGPKGTIGIIVNNKLKMVEIDNIERLDEMDHKSLNGLFRLKELAGLGSTEPADEIVDDGLTSEMPMDSEFDNSGEYDTISPYGDDEFSIDDSSVDEFSSEVLPEQSDAYCEITCKLDEVQNLLPDVKLGEYKNLISQLENLVNVIRESGRAFVTERHNK